MTPEQVRTIFEYNPETGEFYKLANGSRGHVKRNGYIRFSHDGRTYSSQRLIWMFMTGKEPEGDIDHIDHDRQNNRWSNLREVDRQGNMRNATKSKANSSGHTGVYWSKAHGKWRAQICVDAKVTVLGSFDDLDDAVSARQEANKAYGFHANHGQ